MQKNDDITLRIDDLTTAGSGIGRSDGMAVFVEGALPGELVKAHIIKVKKNYAIGKLTEILEESPLRLTPRCAVFGTCGGCTLQDLAYAGQLSWKQDHLNDCLKRIGGVEGIDPLYPQPSIKPWHYRNKAAYALEERDGKVAIGFYELHSHKVVDVEEQCWIQHSYTKLIISQLRAWIAKSGVSIYNEEKHEGLLRRIVIRSNNKEEFMVILVINGDEIPDEKRLLQLFKLALPRVTSIVLNINKRRTNTIMGSRNIPIVGDGYLTEVICGLHYRFGPNSFMQVNHQQMEAMYLHLLRELRIKKSETVFDLYCGIGTITLLAAQQAKQAIGVEVVEEAVENAEFNALQNEIENAEFHAGDAPEWIRRLVDDGIRPNVLIVDPPRKGLTKELIETAAEARPRAIGYVSCDPATLARDLKEFRALGYKPRGAQGYDLFPQTTHLETVAILEPAEA